MDWTEESITRLRSLWQDGLSTAEIGRRMQITKNAVVGKAHRLTLPPRPSPIRKGLELASTGLQTQRTALDDQAGPMLAAPEPVPQRPIAVVTRAPAAAMQPTPAPVVAVPVPVAGLSSEWMSPWMSPVGMREASPSASCAARGGSRLSA